MQQPENNQQSRMLCFTVEAEALTAKQFITKLTEMIVMDGTVRMRFEGVDDSASSE